MIIINITISDDSMPDPDFVPVKVLKTNHLHRFACGCSHSLVKYLLELFLILFYCSQDILLQNLMTSVVTHHCRRKVSWEGEGGKSFKSRTLTFCRINWTFQEPTFKSPFGLKIIGAAKKVIKFTESPIWRLLKCPPAFLDLNDCKDSCATSRI